MIFSVLQEKYLAANIILPGIMANDKTRFVLAFIVSEMIYFAYDNHKVW